MTDRAASTPARSGGNGSAPTRRRRRSNGNGTPGTYAPAETRRALLESAKQLFERNGFAETTVQEIVEHADLTKGAFYHHFDCKEEMLRQIHDEYIEYQVESVRKVLESTDDPVEQLRQLVYLSVRSVSTHRSHVAVFLQERRYLTGERFASVKERRDVVEGGFVDIIRRGIEAGVFRKTAAPRVVAFGIIGMSAWVHQWYDDTGRLTVDDIAEIFWSMVYDGLRTD